MTDSGLHRVVSESALAAAKAAFEQVEPRLEGMEKTVSEIRKQQVADAKDTGKLLEAVKNAHHRINDEREDREKADNAMEKRLNAKIDSGDDKAKGPGRAWSAAIILAIGTAVTGIVTGIIAALKDQPVHASPPAAHGKEGK